MRLYHGHHDKQKGSALTSSSVSGAHQQQWHPAHMNTSGQELYGSAGSIGMPQFQGFTTNSPPPAYTAPPPHLHHNPGYGGKPPMPTRYQQCYPSPPLGSIGQLRPDYTGTTSSPPPVAKESGLLKSQWNRAERLASKSCHDLSAQLSSGANKGAHMVNKSVHLTNKGVMSMTNNLVVRPTAMVTNRSVQAITQGAALCDRLSTKLDTVLTSMDGGGFSGQEEDLWLEADETMLRASSTLHPQMSQDRALGAAKTPSGNGKKGSNYFCKVWLYSNSRLPPHLPPFKVYMPTYPLLCMAATYSERAYSPNVPHISEAETHIPSDWRSGTKAMVLKALPLDDMNVIVFAIRGSQTFMDWAVNYKSKPASPEGFLDDPGNMCHAGFLHVARKMIKPVADRLRVLLEENPARSHASLLITGHSAGGAVAALLFAHMLSTTVQSELSYLTGFFKRVHCVTFGAPPITLLPLQKPNERRHKKSLFYAFINEGDPVPRADRKFVADLLKLYSSATPTSSITSGAALAGMSRLNLSSNKLARPSKASPKPTTSANATMVAGPIWPIVSTTLCPAGQLIVLRERSGGLGPEDVQAVTVNDEILRKVVYGDPLMHVMRLYRSRIETIATRAVTAAG